MGYYYGTCFMSNIHILTGEEVAIFVLAPSHTDTTPGFGYYPDSKFKTIGFPIIAEFDEDTGFRNINHVNAYAEEYFRSAIQMYRKKRSEDDGTVFEEYHWEDIDQFVQRLMYGELFVRCEDDEIRQMSYVMMHEGLRQNLLVHMGSRIPYDNTENLRRLIKNKVQTSIDECKKTYSWWIECPNEVRQKFPYKADFSLWSSIESYEPWDNLNIMVTYYIKSPENEIVDEIAEYAIWRYVMSRSRKGYHCNPLGGQCEDMMCQAIIAEFVLDKFEEREKTRRVKEYVSF